MNDTTYTAATGWLGLGDLLRERARSRGDHVAAICGDDAFTYRQLDERVDALARGLAAEGLGPGDRALWLGKNCHRLFEAVLACARRGATLVPANWRQAPEELAWLVDDLCPRLVFWETSGLGGLAERTRQAAVCEARWICHDGEHEDGYENVLIAGAEGHGDPTAQVDPRAPVFGVYTSAFSGKPSCALLDHAAITLQCLVVASVHDIGPDTVFLNSGPLFHVGTAMSTFATFLLGATNVFVPDAGARGVCEAIVAHRVTRAFIVEPTRSRIVELVAAEGYDLRTLRGWPGSPEWNAVITPDTSPWGRDVGGYGQTEVMGHVSFRGLAPGAEGEHGRTTPIVALGVLDDEGRQLPAGAVGELAVCGPQVMVGYHGRPDENARRRQAPGWHRTNDLGRREPDGSVTFVGPKARMLKSGVENVYPAEVEACVAAHAAVAECAVIGVPDPVWVQNVTAVVVRQPGAELDEAAVVAHCRMRIASYKKPKKVIFVDELPRKGPFVDYDVLDQQHGGGNYPGGSVRATRGSAPDVPAGPATPAPSGTGAR